MLKNFRQFCIVLLGKRQWWQKQSEDRQLLPLQIVPCLLLHFQKLYLPISLKYLAYLALFSSLFLALFLAYFFSPFDHFH